MMAVIVVVALGGCTAKKLATSEILEERMRRPGGSMTVPPSPAQDGAEKGMGAGR